MKILICGFSGAGKTTWLERLKAFGRAETQFEFIDLDFYIARLVNVDESRLGEWINTNSLAVFRELEEKKLIELINSSKNLVISLGGGSLNQKILDVLKENTDSVKLIFLDTPIDQCIIRIKNDSNKILSKLSREKLRSLYLSRLNFYRQADLQLSPEAILMFEDIDSLVHTLNSN